MQVIVEVGTAMIARWPAIMHCLSQTDGNVSNKNVTFPLRYWGIQQTF